MQGYVFHFFNPHAGVLAKATLETDKGSVWLKYRLGGKLLEMPVNDKIQPVTMEMPGLFNLGKKKEFLFVVNGDNFVWLEDGKGRIIEEKILNDEGKEIGKNKTTMSAFQVQGEVPHAVEKALRENAHAIAILDYIRNKGGDGWKVWALYALMALGVMAIAVKWILPQFGIVLI